MVGSLIRINVVALPRAEDNFDQKPTEWRTIMADSQLRQDIIDELEFDPSFNGEHIGVVVDKNVVTLTGHVNS